MKQKKYRKEKKITMKMPKKYSKCIFYFKTPCQLVPINFTFLCVCVCVCVCYSSSSRNKLFFNVLRLKSRVKNMRTKRNKKKINMKKKDHGIRQNKEKLREQIRNNLLQTNEHINQNLKGIV